MTNDEAIETLKTFSRIRGGEEREAMQLAIAVLEDRPRWIRELKSLDGIAETCNKLDAALNMACTELAAVTATQYHESSETVAKAYYTRYSKQAGINPEATN